MSQAHRRQQAAQDADGDQGDQGAESSDLRGPQQEMAPPDENQNFNKPPAHTTQPIGLNSNEQQMLGVVTTGRGQVMQGQYGAPQKECVASDGSQGAEPMTHAPMLGDQQGRETLVAHRTIREPPNLVNSKQYPGILRRRAAREKNESPTRWSNQTPRKAYMHESRHQWAKQRPRNSRGQFCKNPVEVEAVREDDFKGHSTGGEETTSLKTKFSSHDHGLKSSNQGAMAQDSRQGLQNPGSLLDLNLPLPNAGFAENLVVRVEEGCDHRAHANILEDRLGPMKEPDPYVNVKQPAILYRDELGDAAGLTIPLQRQQYLYETPDMDAKTIPGGSGGQFLSTRGQGEAVAKTDSNGQPNNREETASLLTKLSSESHVLQHSNQGIIGQESESQGLQSPGLWNSQSTRLVQDSRQSLQDEGPSSLNGLESPGLQGTMMVEDSTQDLKNKGSSNSQSILVQKSNQGGVQQPKRKRKKKSTETQRLP